MYATYRVKQMLISRSQLQPVMNAAAAGGKRIATLAKVHPMTNVNQLMRVKRRRKETDDDKDNVCCFDHCVSLL
jgi:hypothetical protein